MNRKKLKIMFATVLCLGAMAAPAMAQVNISIDLGIAPPPPRVEVIHEGRPGFVWIEGFWYWDGHKHRWSKGHWEHERPGHHWVAPRWEPRGDRHHYEPGRWEPDLRDRDDRDDHRGPGNHGRGNAYGHDRDDRDDDRGGDQGHGRGHR
ncbi:YXWGXW repeat-containing protein [Humidesulfovibrio idahonensis]